MLQTRVTKHATGALSTDGRVYTDAGPHVIAAFSAQDCTRLGGALAYAPAARAGPFRRLQERASAPRACTLLASSTLPSAHTAASVGSSKSPADFFPGVSSSPKSPRPAALGHRLRFVSRGRVGRATRSRWSEEDGDEVGEGGVKLDGRRGQGGGKRTGDEVKVE